MFDLDHVFVNFPPGAGGNFVTAIIKNICSNNIKQIKLNNNGSFHILDSGKREEKDSISFGSTPEENLIFNSIEDRSNHYLKLIKQEYIEPRRIITWSHDYTNLPLYKKHFPKCKTLAITTFTVKEKLIAMIMHINKVVLTSEDDIVISLKLWKELRDKLSMIINYKVKSKLKSNLDYRFIFNNRFEEHYSDIVFYYSMIAVLEHYKQYDVLDLIGEDIVRDNNAVSMLNWYNGYRKEKISESSDAALSFEDLCYGDIKNFIESISSTLNKKFTLEENEYLKSNFFFYKNLQDDNILNDPIKYFYNRKDKALDQISKL